MRKKSIIRVINDFPANVKLDEVIERLVVLEKIEAGLNDLKEGNTISHESVKRRVKRWSK
jgi:predicted transcriptional regulator